MKKTISILLSLMLLLSFYGCKKEEVNPYPDRDVQLPTVLPASDEDMIAIHYQRKDNTYNNWTLWLWNPEGTDDSKEDDFNYQDDYGVIAYYPLSYFDPSPFNRLGIIVKTKGSWTKDGTNDDRFIVFSTLTRDENNTYHIYLANDDAHLYQTSEKIVTDAITTCTFYSENIIYVVASNKLEHYRVYCDGEMIGEGNGSGKTFFSYKMDTTADFSRKYSVELLFRESGQTLTSDVEMSSLYSSDTFNDLYYYDGLLGAEYSKEKTTFRVWSPVSSRIVLRVYDNGTPEKVSKEKGSDVHQDYEMIKGDKGVFEYTVKEDMQGKYYTYVVYNSSYNGMEICDPYARAAGVNGTRGMVADFALTNPEGWDKVKQLNYNRNELTVWEMHIADITSNETWTGSEENRRRYLGVVEEGTTFSRDGVTVTTGFDHIKELGVNAVQLQPVYDQANDETLYSFNWGYNPLNYNVVEGLYSSDPYDGYTRIREFKQMIQKFNQAGIEVIMDVVYNHVSSANGSNFDVLMPGYYFRYDNGRLSNGSGCGNETASENKMMRKFIIDSISFWMQEYKLSGFRFDLMGLHDIETMNEVEKAAEKIYKNVVIYGEPWTGGTSPLPEENQAKQVNANKFVGYGQFNDQMRDALIKGGLNAATDRGWITSDKAAAQFEVSAIQNGINGITYNLMYTIDDVNKTVNYVTCHDNYTLYDRIRAAGISDEDTIRKMALLANSVVFTSKGTTFMLAGEEMLRTKQGDSNSYCSSDEINGFNYNWKIDNIDIFNSYKKLIEFKQKTKGLHSKDNSIEVNVTDGTGVIIYTVDDYMIVHSNGIETHGSVDTNGYEVWLDTLDKLSGKIDSFTPEKYQTVILRKVR